MNVHVTEFSAVLHSNFYVFVKCKYFSVVWLIRFKYIGKIKFKIRNMIFKHKLKGLSFSS